MSTYPEARLESFLIDGLKAKGREEPVRLPGLALNRGID